MRQPESAISKRMSEITKTPSKKTGKTKLMADFQNTRNLIRGTQRGYSSKPLTIALLNVL